MKSHCDQIRGGVERLIAICEAPSTEGGVEEQVQQAVSAVVTASRRLASLVEVQDGGEDHVEGLRLELAQKEEVLRRLKARLSQWRKTLARLDAETEQALVLGPPAAEAARLREGGVPMSAPGLT